MKICQNVTWCTEDKTDHLDDPWNTIARVVLHFPELTAKHLTESITDQEDGVYCHFLKGSVSADVSTWIKGESHLGMTGRSDSYPWEYSDKSSPASTQKIDCKQKSTLSGPGEEEQKETSTPRKDESANSDIRASILKKWKLERVYWRKQINVLAICGGQGLQLWRRW